MRKLEEQRQRQKAEIAEHRDMRLRTAMDEFEREKKAAEDDFKAEEENLRERFLNEFEDKRRRTDEGRYDGNFSQMRAAAIRKMRTRSNVDPSAAASRQDAAKNKREKLTWPSVQFALKPTEVHDDLEEVQRAYNQSVRHAEGTRERERAPCCRCARHAHANPRPGWPPLRAARRLAQRRPARRCSLQRRRARRLSSQSLPPRARPGRAPRCPTSISRASPPPRWSARASPSGTRRRRRAAAWTCRTPAR